VLFLAEAGSLDAESEEESEDGVILERVALDSEPCFLVSSASESLSELDVSESESGKGVFLASDCVEESESEEESEDEESLLEELALPALVFFFLWPELALELESESEDDESLLEDLEDLSSELELLLEPDEEEESEDEVESLLEDLDDFLTFFVFFDFFLSFFSSSELELELESDEDDDEPLLDED